jgi:large subunit ribosomal protein L28
MAKVCAICGKKPVVGNKVVQSGKAKREGGVGKKTTGITKTWKLPNLQRVKMHTGSGARGARVCTSCIRSGKTVGL